MAKFSSKGIDPYISETILNFLNSAKDHHAIRSLKGISTATYDISESVARSILEKRDQLGGFKNLSQLGDVKGLGTDKLNELIAIFSETSLVPTKEIYEPLFRFASLRYHGISGAAAKSVQRKSNEQTPAPEDKVRRLSKTELIELEKAHVATLAKGDLLIINGLFKKLESLAVEYYEQQQEALQVATKEHNELIKKNIQLYEKGLSNELKKELDDKKRSLTAKATKDSDQPENRFTDIYPSFLFSSLEFKYHAFNSSEFFKDKLTARELGFLTQNNLLNTDAITLKRRLNDLINEKHKIASYSELKSKKKVAVGGTSIVLKNRYNQGYAISIDPKNKLLHLSLITAKAKTYFTKANISIEINGKLLKADKTTLIENNTRKLFLESSFEKLPDLANVQMFTYEVTIELNSKETIVIKETVSSHNDIWVGQYVTGSRNELVLKTKSAKPIKNLHGILRLGWADLMRVEQKLCCYLPGEVSHIENIMAREYKEKSTEYLERSENTFVTESETETIEKNDTTTVEKNDWNNEISRTLENSFNFGLGTTVSYGSQNGPWSASINADMSIANSQSQASTNAQSYSKEITQSASESIRVRSFEKRTTTLIKQFKEENKHGFDNRAGENHVSGIFRWIDKIYKNRIVNYGKGMLYEFMIPKPSELYVETLAEAGEQPPPPIAPEPPGLKSWQDVTRDNFMQYINDYQVTNYQLPKDAIKYDVMNIPHTNEPFDWDNENKNGFTTTYNFNSVLAADYYLEAVLPTSLANTTDWKIRVHNFWQHSYARFQVSLQKAGANPVTIVYNNSFASRLAWEEDVAGNVMNISGLSYETNVDVKVYGSCVRYLDYLNLNFRFKLKAASYQQWQQDTFNAIMTAYQAQVDAYNEALALLENEITNESDDTNTYKHPGAYLEIIQTEIKRLCIELLLQNTDLDRCQEFYVTTQCRNTEDCEKIPMLTNLDQLDEYASMVKFLEQSFHWSLSSYNLYPYYWAGKCDWADMLHNEDTPDNEFQKFLKSGMARVLVPVREGFEKAVAYFIATGQPWFNGEPPTIDDPLYVSVVRELSLPTGNPVGDPWNTHVPSTLTLIQADTVYLQNQGLPCCEDLTGRGSGINPSKNKLVGKDDSK
jgi:hypothetical protein